jgi:hypothetical protein
MKFLDRCESVLIDQIDCPLADDIFSIGVPWVRTRCGAARTNIDLLENHSAGRPCGISADGDKQDAKSRQEFYKFHMGAVQASPFGGRGTP